MTVTISGFDHFLNRPTQDTFEVDASKDVKVQLEHLREKAERSYGGVCWTFSKADVSKAEADR